MENITIIKKRSQATQAMRKSVNTMPESSKLKRSTTILLTEQRLKSESQNLQYCLKILLNMVKEEKQESLPDIIQDERLEYLVRILKHLTDDLESVENTVRLLSEIISNDDLMQTFLSLGGKEALLQVNIQVSNAKTKDLVERLIEYIEEEQKDDENSSSSDDEEKHSDCSEGEQKDKVKINEPQHTNQDDDDENPFQVRERSTKKVQEQRTPSKRMSIRTPSNFSKRVSKLLRAEDFTDGQIDLLTLQMKETIKNQASEIAQLNLANQKKQKEIENFQTKYNDIQDENKNYRDEILDQTRVLTDKILQLKREQDQVRQLKEKVELLNQLTGGEELRMQQEEANQAAEYLQLRVDQLEELYQNQLQEIEQINQVKHEQELLLIELQKSTNYERAAFVNVLSKEDVGTPNESANSEVDQLETELEERNLQIQQLNEQLQEAQTANEKIKFLEEKIKNYKDKLQSVEQHNSKNFWDLDIISTNSSLLTLNNDCWQFIIKNPEGLADYSQQISIFGFDSLILQQFVDVSFNYSKQAEGIYDTITSSSFTHLKGITPSYLHVSKVGKKQQQQQTFLLLARLLNRNNYQKGYNKEISQKSDDQCALEEFWFQYSLNQLGTIVLVFEQLGNEEIELINKLSYMQVMAGQQRLLIFVVKQGLFTIKEQRLSKYLCGTLQMLPGSLSQEDSIHSQRVLFEISYQKQTRSEVQLFMQQVIKSDSVKLKQQFTFVDQIREYIIGNYSQFFILQGQPDFKVEQPQDEIEGFNLTLISTQEGKGKLKQDRPTNIITSQSILNTKFEENGDILIEIIVPSGEQIKKEVIKVFHIEGQGTKIQIKVTTDFGTDDEDMIYNHKYVQFIPQWFVIVKQKENLVHRLNIILQQYQPEQMEVQQEEQ